MRCYIRYRALRATPPLALLALLTFGAVSACTEDAPLPTSPRAAMPGRPRATVVVTNVTVLPTVDGFPAGANDINEAGQVAGSMAVRLLPGLPQFAEHAILWSPLGGLQDLGTVGGTYSRALAINELGQVVGLSAPPGDAADHAFLWTAATGMQDLGTLGGPSSWATGINDAGDVVGWSDTPGDVARHAFLWSPTRGMQDLGTLGGSMSRAAAINNAGQVVGGSFVESGHERAFLWTAADGMKDLGHLGGNFSRAAAINDAGEVVGMSNTGPGGSDLHAFLWTPAQGMRDLGVLPDGMTSEAYDINDLGQIVGWGDSPHDPHFFAFVWTAVDGMVNIYPGTQLSIAKAINNRGQVVAHNRVATLRFIPPNRAPIANAGRPYEGAKKKAVAFDGTRSTDPDGDAITYTWDFGDGTPAVGGATPAHEYETWGTYTVTLTVSDPGGLSGTQTTTATIAPPGHLKSRQ